MIQEFVTIRPNMNRYLRNFLLGGLLALSASACAPRGHVSTPTFESEQYTFTDPKQAVSTLKTALERNDRAELTRIFGPKSADLISSGDDVADRRSFKAFADDMNENVDIVETVNQNPALKNQRLAFLYVGDHRYPFPIALHKRANGWRFDTAVGKEEVINRRVGRNEIKAIEALNRIVSAQRNFFESQATEGKPHQYAQRFLSSPGKRDGLYWEKVEGAPASPLGSAIATASAQGYSIKDLRARGAYYGYRFAILTAQGPKARGEAMSYIDNNGRMTKGFGLLAYPVKFGESGIMTFVAGPDGIIYQKNLGPKTESIAQTIKSVNPDLSWIPVR
jgi:hypothetical protein